MYNINHNPTPDILHGSSVSMFQNPNPEYAAGERKQLNVKYDF